MIIKHEFPPNIERIRSKFELSGKEIFTYGDVIYNPTGIQLPIQIIEHEKVHIEQQKTMDKDLWWSHYLLNKDFRLNQEIEAHRAEYKTFCLHNLDRNIRIRMLHLMARRLSSKMYGNMITFIEAIKRIK